MAGAPSQNFMDLVNVTYLLRKAQTLKLQTSNRFEELWYQGYIAAIEMIIKFMKGEKK